MAQFEFRISSDDEGEIAGLMLRLFEKHTMPAAKSAVPAAKPMTDAPHISAKEVEPEEEVEQPVRRTRRTKAQMEADNAVEADEPAAEPVDQSPNEADESEREITLDMVKKLGSKAMETIKASGVAAIFKSHGGGAESFGSLKPETYGAVYTAFEEVLA